jgi:hypothetical protein
MANKIRWERHEWEPYFRAIADRMGLKDWDVDLTDHPPTRGTSNAECYCVFGRKVIQFWLSEDFLRDPEWHQRLTVVHELLHAHYAMADEIAEDGLDPKVHFAYRQALEHGVDGIAKPFSALLPLPSEILAPEEDPDVEMIES